MPLGAIAQSLEAISGPTHGKSGDTLTFVVEARDSDGNPQSEVEVLFGKLPSDDTSDWALTVPQPTCRRTRKDNTDT